MHACAVFQKNIYGFTAAVVPIYDYDSGTDPKAEMQSEIIEMKITGVQINFVIKQTFLFFYWQTCLVAANWLDSKLTTAPTTVL